MPAARLAQVNEDAKEISELQQELLDADPASIVANHAYGLFELAALYLSATPPRLTEATLAIDSLAGLMSAVEDRLGDSSAELKEALRQLQLAYIQVSQLGQDES